MAPLDFAASSDPYDFAEDSEPAVGAAPDFSGFSDPTEEPGIGTVISQGVQRGVAANVRAAKQAGQLAGGKVPDVAEPAQDDVSEFTTAPFDFSSPPTSF